MGVGHHDLAQAMVGGMPTLRKHELPCDYVGSAPAWNDAQERDLQSASVAASDEASHRSIVRRLHDPNIALCRVSETWS